MGKNLNPKALLVAILGILLLGGWLIFENKKSAQITLTEEPLKPQEERAPEIKNIILQKVPFAAQAPLGDWSDSRQQSGCEEAVALMAVRWAEGKELTLAEAEKEIIALADYQKENYGVFHDTSAADTAERIFKGYFNYGQVEVRYEIGTEDIKKELALGNLVIVPINGQRINNPYYTPPGPIQHQILVIGYDPLSEEFIAHDPGTRHGAEFRYPVLVLENALQDYPTGIHRPVVEVNKAMIIIKSKS